MKDKYFRIKPIFSMIISMTFKMFIIFRWLLNIDIVMHGIKQVNILHEIEFLLITLKLIEGNS